jgi:hypothetical protein
MQKKFLLTGALLALSFNSAVWAQGPVGDEVVVSFNKPVQVGSHTLSAGEYTVRQLTSASNPRVLEFTSNHGTKLEATVTAIPIMQNTPPSETKVIFEEEGGGTPVLHRIWVQGKTYGYEFPGKAVAAPPAPTVALNLQASFEAPPPPVQAQVTPAPRREEPVVVAQAPPPPPPPPAPAPETPAPAPPPVVPATALGWGDILLAGLSLTGIGLFLYRRTA